MDVLHLALSPHLVHAGLEWASMAGKSRKQEAAISGSIILGDDYSVSSFLSRGYAVFSR